MITTAIIIAAVVLFIHATTWRGMILERPANYIAERAEWLAKPLFDCPVCMCPYWGILLYAAGHAARVPGFESNRPGVWIATVLIACGFSTVSILISCAVDLFRGMLDDRDGVDRELESIVDKLNDL